MDGPTQTSLEGMGLADVDELLSLPTAEVAARLGAAPFPPSEKLIGAVLLRAVDELRGATADVALSSRQIDSGTKSLITLARLTLGIAVLALIVSVVTAVQ